MKNVSELNLLRACIVYMIHISDSTDPRFEIDEWKYLNLEGSYFSWTNKTAKVFSRLMLPGKYELYDQAFYLFGSSGKILQSELTELCHLIDLYLVFNYLVNSNTKYVIYRHNYEIITMLKSIF